MKTGVPRVFRRSVLLAAVGILAVVLTACRGVGGGYLPPGPSASDLFPGTVFTGQASFGFTFSCEDKGGLNPPTGQLHIELAYNDHGSSLLLGGPFSIHGIVDKIDPVVESQVCSGQQPPPEPLPPNVLIFLGRYRLTSSAPSGFPSTCPSRETKTSPLCRFEVMVQDNDRNLRPSVGDFFSIKLSKVPVFCGGAPVPDPRCSVLDPATVFYARAGYLAGGNITVR